MDGEAQQMPQGNETQASWREAIQEEEGGHIFHRNVQRFRGGLVFKAQRLCVSLNSRLESNEGKEKG